LNGVFFYNNQFLSNFCEIFNRTFYDVARDYFSTYFDKYIFTNFYRYEDSKVII